MRAETRQLVRGTYAFRCGYCGVSEIDAGAELTVDHYQPVSRGGTDHPDNLVYACHPCNVFKGDDWHPDSARRVLHPLLDDLTEHLSEQADGVLIGLTEMGRYHLDRLRLNRLPLVQHRREARRVEARSLINEELLQRIDVLEHWVQELSDELKRYQRESG